MNCCFNRLKYSTLIGHNMTPAKFIYKTGSMPAAGALAHMNRNYEPGRIFDTLNAQALNRKA